MSHGILGLLRVRGRRVERYRIDHPEVVHCLRRDGRKLDLGYIGQPIIVCIYPHVGIVENLTSLLGELGDECRVRRCLFYLGENLALRKDCCVHDLVGILETGDLGGHGSWCFVDRFLLFDLDRAQVVDDVTDLLLVHRPAPGQAPGRHGRVPTAKGDPEIELGVVIPVQHVVEGGHRP